MARPPKTSRTTESAPKPVPKPAPKPAARRRASAPRTAGTADLTPIAPVPRVRRTQAERSRSTRERLMLATVELMRLRGYGGLTTAEISDRAGVSRGAQLHHFPTKNDLVLDTLRFLNERMLETSFARAERALASRADPIDALVEDAFEFFFSDFFYITLAIRMSDERNEALLTGITPIVGPSRFRIEQRWTEVLTEAGWPRQLAEDMLALTFSIVRGFMIRRQIQDDRKRFEALMKVWKGMVAEQLRLAGMASDATRRKARKS